MRAMPVFDSFFMGGFECADHINRSGARVNLLRETEHDVRAESDYRLLAASGIKTVREGICWSVVEPAPYCYDFSSIEQRLQAAERSGIQQVWDICHFGYPDGIYPTHPHFTSRFAALCTAFANFHKEKSSRRLLVVPINEISFLAWHSGDVRGTVPFAINCGFDIKYHLCKAAIAGIERLRAVVPDCRIILVEPLIRVHGRADSNFAELLSLNEAQFQAVDIIAGRMCPELGGTEANIDILGVNYYWDCQWQHHGQPLEWPEANLNAAGSAQLSPLQSSEHLVSEDATTLVLAKPQAVAKGPRRIPLATLLAMVHARYERPLFLAETGHFGSGRARWLDEVTSECLAAMAEGIELLGVCLYPVTDRPDWDDLSHYHNSGLWDFDVNKERVPNAEYVAMLRECISRVENSIPPRARSIPVWIE